MVKNCAHCDKEFKVKPSHYDKKTYCSRACMAIAYKSRLKGESNPNYRGVAEDRVCPCGNTFSVQTVAAVGKYCSHSCAAKYRPDSIEHLKTIAPKGAEAIKRKWARRKKKLKTRTCTCATCGKVFKSTGDGKRKYCTECAPMFSKHGIGRKTQLGRSCAICGKYFESHNSMTCSSDCARIYRAKIQEGDKSHRWQGGKTSAALIIRSCIEYTLWREYVFDRDDYTCQMCHKRGGQLAAHHIKPFSTHDHLRTDKSNGVALCWPCHRSIKNKEGDYEDLFSGIVARNEANKAAK